MRDKILLDLHNLINLIPFQKEAVCFHHRLWIMNPHSSRFHPHSWLQSINNRYYFFTLWSWTLTFKKVAQPSLFQSFKSTSDIVRIYFEFSIGQNFLYVLELLLIRVLKLLGYWNKSLGVFEGKAVQIYHVSFRISLLPKATLRRNRWRK